MKPVNKNILHTYLNRLTNLSGNSRSLLLLRLPAEQTIDLHEFNFLTKEGSFDIIAALMGNRHKKICPVLDSRVEASNVISQKLKRLYRLDRFIYEERGSNDLHIGWPFIHGKFSDGTLVRAPLIYFPVSLTQMNNEWVLQPREDAGISFNKTFLLAYSFYNKVDVQEDLLDTVFDDFDADTTVWRTELYQLLKDRVEINFNPDNFRNELIPFEEFKKADFEQSHRDGELKLFPEAVLGIFPQAGSQLVPDYIHLLEAEAFDDLEDFFLKRNTVAADEEPNVTIREEKIFTPLSMDAWQENALRKIKAGKSIVVQGPPGTGKSQLICNLLADAIASGKRALLVCQKRAALDVAYQRLYEIELGDFLGLVHDFRNDRRDLFEKIGRQIEKIEDYKARHRSIDIIQMERRFFQVCRSIDQISEELDEFKQVLYNDKECGLSVKELYLSSNPQGDSINIKQEYQHFNFHDLDDFYSKLKRYARYATQFERDDYLWRNRQSFATLGLSQLKEIMEVISEIPVFQARIQEKVQALLPAQLTLEDNEAILRREDDILGMLSVLNDDDTYRYFQRMVEEKDEETSLLWFSNVERVMMSCYQNGGPEKTLPAEQLGKLQAALKLRMDARRSLIRRIRWEFFSDDNYWIKRVLVANDLEYNKKGLRSLEHKLDSRLNLEHHLTALKSKPWLLDIPENYDQRALKRWFERQKFAIRAKVIFNSLREVKDAVTPQKMTRQEFISLFHSLLSVIEVIPVKKAGWIKHITTYQYRQIIHDPAIAEQYIQVANRDFENLCVFDKLKEELKPHELSVMGKLHDHAGHWNYEPLRTIFHNSLALAWIDYIETKYPILRMVSSMHMDELQTELQHLVIEKKRLSKDILLLRAQEKVYEDIEYNRLNNRVTYRDLHHQVTKKKKIWPLRKVIAQFQDELFKLVPCWMASPESVSAIFPMKEVFDLIIFDEASQCFAERGVPAMYRGRQVLIAGDSKQLKPFELYQVRWNDDNEHPDTEVDSLLDLAERYLEGDHLQGHYRSRAPELIDFSNRHFYGGRLKLLPDRAWINRREPAIVYENVKGVWENNVNVIEAEHIVRHVFHFLEEKPELSLGIVTFNAPQQMLITDLIEQRSRESGIAVPSSLFIKNIENVQGDEKDVIIFSVGYAPDKKGKMLMQFGSLNLPGGENRLNVAITRARQHCIIVTSVDPEQLQVEDSKNDGPKLLRAYLDFARHVQKGEFVPVVHTDDTLPRSGDWYLNDKLKTWAQTTFADVSFSVNALPFSDVCLLQNGEYVGVILTDDDRYAATLSAKDAHAYTLEALTQKHWEYKVIFSRNFWIDREKVENELMRLIGSQKG